MTPENTFGEISKITLDIVCRCAKIYFIKCIGIVIFFYVYKMLVGSIVFIKTINTKEKNSSADNLHFLHHTPVNLASEF